MHRWLTALALLTLFLLPILLPTEAISAPPDRDAFPEPDSARLDEIDEYQNPEARSAYFDSEWLDDRIAPWQDFKDRVNEEWGLDFFIGWSPQFHASTADNDNTFIGDEWDLIGEWRVMDDETFGKGRVQFWFLHVQTWGNNKGAEFQKGTGSMWELNDLDTGGSNNLNAIGILWWEQLAFEDRLQIIVGKLDPRLLVNTNRFLWNDRVLFNFETLASDPVVATNGARALGAFAKIKLGPVYASGLWIDADSNIKSVDFRTLDNGNYSWSAEGGLELDVPGLGEGNYRGSWFKQDRVSSGSGGKKVYGGAISVDQDLGESFAAFGYWSTRSGRKGSLRQNLSTGIVLRQPFGLTHDFVGVGFSWGVQDGRGKDQYGVEAFWRFQIIDRVEFTPVLQYVIDPVDSTKDGHLAGALRLRVYL